MEKSKRYRISLVVLSIICITSLAVTANAKNPPPAKVPSYYPGDGISVKFEEESPFAFLWPERWSKRSALSFVLVVKNENQTAEEAISNNRPLYQEHNITSYYVLYPFDRQPLENGEYAWQVTDERGHVLLTTNFWIDSVPSEPYELFLLETLCMHPKEKQDGSYQVAYDKYLYIHTTEPYEVAATQKLRFCIYDSHRNIILRTDEEGIVVEYAAAPITSPSIQTGENWLRFNVGANCCFYEDDTHSCKDDYYLEVWDGRGEKRFLRFRCMRSMPQIVPGGGDL